MHSQSSGKLLKLVKFLCSVFLHPLLQTSPTSQSFWGSTVYTLTLYHTWSWPIHSPHILRLRGSYLFIPNTDTVWNGRFLNLNTVNIQDWIILLLKKTVSYYRIFSNTLGLHTLDNLVVTHHTSGDNQNWFLIMSPRGSKWPLVRNH